MRGAVSVTARVLCQSGASHAATIPLIHAETSAPSAAPPEPVPPEPVPPAPVPPAPVPPAPVRSAPEPTAAAAPAEADQGPDEILPSAAEPSPGAPDGPAWDLGRAILLICDHAVVTAESMLRVRGWSACGHGIERVSIAVDGRHLGDAEYGRERPDVAVDYPGMPVATGFIFEQTVPGLAGGAHELRLTAVSHAGDRKDIAVPVRPPATAAFRFELDGPATKDGVAIRPVSGRLLIEGWALARDGMAGIDVELDGTPLGHAHYGMARPDVGAAFPDWDGASRAGYTFHCPARALPEGEHVIQLTARSKTGEAHVHAFHITVRKTDNPEAEASIRRRIKRVERNMVDGVLDQLGWRPAFHLIVTGDADAQEAARTLTIRSIVEQSWSAWRVTVLGSDAAEAEATRDTIARLAPEDAGRFAVIDPADPAWTAPFVIGETASLVGVLAIGDELGRDALGAFAIATGVHPNADCLYADEFRLAPGGTRPEAFFKPDFSPGLSLAANYLGRPLIARPSLLERIGTTPESLLRDGFHDLALRCAEAAADIRHVPELLSRTDGAGAANRDHGADPSRAAMDRRGIAAEVLPGAAPSTWRVRRTAPVTGKVSIIIPTRAAKGHIETCLKTLRDVTAYRNFEIVCIDNIPSTEPRWKEFVRRHADKVVEIPPPFNWSRFNNDAATAADGEYLLFLNDDIEIEQPDWLETMLEAASWPGVGIVGARLLYPNRTVQHAGMFLGDGMGRHAFRHAEETDPGYFGLALTTREMIAVTGACLLVRRDIFDRLGRFDEAHDVINNDLDFCLRAHRAGLRTIYTPYATLIHHELASRESLAEDYDTARFTGAWRGLFAAGDPYFNPRMSRYSDDYRLDDEGVLAMYAGHPLLDRAAVKAILVVKVDHIGDFIISLPAIRRLKTAFPMAKLVALVAPASAAIASVEPAIDEAIPFEFFHERSELGEKALTEVELEALTARLAPYRFDIAVDLRKHLSTRHLLLCAGARITAGYDSLENFPWLDVVLEWDGDKALQRKRSHIVDDLVNLSAAIETACEPDRRLFHPAPEPMPVSELPEHARHLFARPVVAIHPGSGNVMRQWPEKHIAPLIDLLLERNDVSVLVVGGRDDEAKAEAIVARVARPDRVATVAGQTRLGDLPRLLAACALFIGGNSGPKHIAAASGVPTIGIHSGVVDPGEWGPMGPRSVALYRDMSCAPCFLAKPEHCPRNLACVEMLDPALVHRTAQMFLAKPERPASVEPMAPPAVKPVRRPAEKKPVKPARRMKVAARK
jgi:ADP-heptose:LPS heptosyltransferase/GT2 family glycosyltransferase